MGKGKGMWMGKLGGGVRRIVPRRGARAKLAERRYLGVTGGWHHLEVEEF